MPEIRKDPVFGRWVIIASGRGKRPNEFRPGDSGAPGVCPFCPGNEEETPPPVYTLPSREKGPAGWRLRVVANKYPALADGAPPQDSPDGMYDRMAGVGFHEVVIETPEHDAQMESLPVPELADVFRTFALRAAEMKKDPRIKYVMVFKNFGRGAGASRSHPHSQIIAMPIAPIRVAQEIDGAAVYRAKNGSCVFCDMLREESALEKRVVGENGGFLALAPYASRFSFETWILPKKHESHFELIDSGLAEDLAAIVKSVIGKLRASIEDLSYNLMIHTMPVQDGPAEHYHWHIEIMPKLSQAAGFEWGTGFYINTVPPETAAEMMNAGIRYRP